jgi:hypothetical protein
VTPDDVGILIDLVDISDGVSEKEAILTALRQLGGFFKKNPDSKGARLTIPFDHYGMLRKVVDAPFMPADAEIRGIPFDRYLAMCARLDRIRSAFDAPEVLDPSFLFYGKAPDSSYLN